MYAVSGNMAPSPAHDSTHTLWPAPARRRTTGGVRATLRSNGPRSRTTPIFIGAPPVKKRPSTGSAGGTACPTIDLVAGPHRGVFVQQLHPDGVQPLRHHRENGTHQGEPEGIVLLAGVAQAGAIEIAFVENVRPESLAERMLLQKAIHELTTHGTSQGWWRRFSAIL